jgi:hypothetical protein
MSNTYPGLGVNVFAAGWGLESNNFTLNILQNVRLTTLTESSCIYQDWLSDTMMCAGKNKLLLNIEITEKFKNMVFLSLFLS